jgi:hypothetical protein
MYKIRTPDYNEYTLTCTDEDLVNYIKEALKTNEFLNLSFTFTTTHPLQDTLSEHFPSMVHTYLHPSNAPFTDMLTILQ